MPDVDRLLNAIDAAESNAYGSDSDGDLAQDRATAIDLYLGRNINPAPVDRSQAVTREVYETIEWTRPALVRIFDGDLVKFEPVGVEDIEQAEQESDYISHVITQENDWLQIRNDWFSDALICKNGYALVQWDETQEVEKHTYQGITDDALAMLAQDAEIVGHEAYPDEEAQPQMFVDPQTGQQIQMPPPMLHDVEVRYSKSNGRTKIVVLPPERVKVSHRTPSFMLTDCPYFEYWQMETISSIRAMGFDVPDDIADDGGETDGSEDDARDIYSEANSRGEDIGQLDPAQRQVRLRRVWIRHDYDDDGISELQYCLIVGRTLLHREECGRIPVACITPKPLAHRHVGLSLADIVADIQVVNTTLLRQGLDNLYLTNNHRNVVNDRVNIDDLLTVRPGGIVRVQGDMSPGDAVLPLVTPFVFPQTMEGMTFMDQRRQTRTGTSAYMTGIDQTAGSGKMNQTASGIAQLQSAGAAQVEQIARVFASGVQYLASLVHECEIKHGHKPRVLRLKGKFVEVNPSEWKRRTDLRITVGLGAGNKQSLMQQLQIIFQAQMAVGPLGVASPKNLHYTLTELAKAADFPNPDAFFNDPEQNPPPPPPPDPKLQLEQARLQMDGQRMQMDLQKGQAEMQQDAQFRSVELQQTAQLEQAKAAQEFELEKLKLQHEMELEAARLQFEMLKAQMEAQNSMQIESQKLQLQASQQAQDAERAEGEKQEKAQKEEADKGQSAAILQQMTALIERLGAPKQVIRDKDGRVVGVQ